jgi:putative DNA methylase
VIVVERRFIESVRFPFREVSEASGVEKGPDRPPHWKMVFWWTRKPLISARAVIAGCLLDENTNPKDFLKSIGIGIGKSAHRIKPKIHFNRIKLLDPFACFGSIPHEAIRLGASVTAGDLLPVGYVFLKTFLEYPLKFGKNLLKDIRKWGNWITEKLQREPLIKDLYDDADVFIGSWEVKCINCNKWTPLVGSWWLAKEGGKKGYKRIVWMEPKVEGNEVKIRVVNLNDVFGNDAVKNATIEGTKVTVNGKEFRVPEKNVEARRQQANCLHCNKPLKYVDPETGKHYTETKTLPKIIKNRLIWYVKFALQLYNQNLVETEAIRSLRKDMPEWLDEVPIRLRLLVKVKQKDLQFEPCTKRDQEKLRKAKQEIDKLVDLQDPDIPTELIAPYEHRSIWVLVYGFTKWYHLFNPRQLLTLVKLVKLIRQAGELIQREKIEKDGMEQREAFKYAEAVTSWLAVALARYVDYNSLCTVWNYGVAKLSAHVAHTISMRGIAMMWNWGDVSPFANITGTGSWLKNINTTAFQSLKYLTNAFQDVKKSSISITLDDATVLSKLNSNKDYDLCVTDPPYYDDVPYSELSDFYYVWLKRALSDLNAGRLCPKFLSEAFFEKVGDDWLEISTQWEKYALSEVSLNPPRLGSNANTEDGVKHFQNLLNSSFIKIASKIEENGLLVTYYAHTDPDAWKALLEAGWETAGLKVSNAFPLATESALSIVSRGKLSMDTSILVVWRGFAEGTIDAPDLYSEMTEEAAKRAKELMDLGAIGRDLVVGTMAAALATATRYREVRFMGKLKVTNLIDKYVYPATYLGLAKALARKAELEEGVKNPDAMYYLLVKSTLAGAKKKTLESTDARIFSIGTSLDLNLATKTWRILKGGEKRPGAKVAKRKTLTLIEPASAERSKLAELLEVRGVGIKEPNIRCTVDALHYMEYLAVAHPRGEFKKKLDEMKAKYPGYFQDALRLARILAKVLPNTDVEKGLCNRIIEYLEPTIPKLDKITK